ncbi:MAG: sensor histidine kinase [Bacillota bacterium]
MGIKRLLTKKFNNVNVKNKLLISYIFLVFLPVLTVGLILTSGMRNMALNHAIKEASLNVERIKKRTADILKVPTDVSKKFYVDQQLKELLSRKYSSTWEVVKSYKGYSEFDQYSALYEEIDGIRVYTFNNTMLNNWRIMRIPNEILKSGWYKEVSDNNGKISWNYIYNEMRNSYYLSLTRVINGTNNNALGILVIDIDMNYLNSLLKEEPFETIITDDKGNIIAAKDTGLVGSGIADLSINRYIRDYNGTIQTDYKGKISKIIVTTFEPGECNNKFKIISIFPVDSIMKDADRISLVGFSIITSSLLLSLILIFISSAMFSRRIKHLSDEMHSVAQGNFDACTIMEGEDEIGQLSKDLNAMVESIKALMHQVYEVNLHKKQLIIKQKEIKLNMLSNQMNPHFLFNALETIRMKAHCNGEVEIAEIIMLLGKLLRRNLEQGSEPVTLETEIDLVKSYLTIQKFRFGEKINYKINMSDDINKYKVLPLIIQPLVENAVIHGLEYKEDTGMVFVSLEESDGIIKISVEDDGVGIDSARLMDIRESLNQPDDFMSKSIGLRNVYQRIKLYYGECYGLKINSEKDKGTRVDVFIPIKE